MFKLSSAMSMLYTSWTA